MTLWRDKSRQLPPSFCEEGQTGVSRCLGRRARNQGGRYAWCVMSNHYHRHSKRREPTWSPAYGCPSSLGPELSMGRAPCHPVQSLPARVRPSFQGSLPAGARRTRPGRDCPPKAWRRWKSGKTSHRFKASMDWGPEIPVRFESVGNLRDQTNRRWRRWRRWQAAGVAVIRPRCLRILAVQLPWSGAVDRESQSSRPLAAKRHKGAHRAKRNSAWRL